MKKFLTLLLSTVFANFASVQAIFAADTILPNPHLSSSGSVYFPNGLILGNAVSGIFYPPGLSATQSIALQNFADCSGTSNQSAALALAVANGGLYIPSGCTIRLATATTITVPVILAPGAKIIADNVNIIFNSSFMTPLQNCLAIAGTGGVSFTGSITNGVLTVSSVSSGTLTTGQAIAGSTMQDGTQITGQLTGTTGGVGTYSISPAGQNNVSSTTMSGVGKFIFSSGVHTTVRPEWWYTASGNWDFALNQAQNSGALDLELSATYYTVTNPWRMTTPYMHYHGQQALNNISPGASRILVASATADACQVGPSFQPSGGVTAYQANNLIEWITCSRNTNPTSAASGSEFTGPAGWRIQYVTNAFISNNYSPENSIGFSVVGAVNTKMDDDFAYRSASDGNSSNYTYYGMWLGQPTQSGLTTDNAELYVSRFVSTQAGSSTFNSSVGINAVGSFTDTYIDKAQTNNNYNGIIFTGTYSGTNACTSNTSTCQLGNIDVNITNCVINSYTQTGIKIQNVNQFGSINLVNNYMESAAPVSGVPSTAALYVFNMHGALSNTNGQIIGYLDYDSSSGNAVGLYVGSSSGFHNSGLKINGFLSPEVFSNVTQSYSSSNITLYGTKSASGSASIVSGTVKNFIDVPVISGSTNIYGGCINVANTTVTYSEFDATAIDGNACNGSKLAYNSTNITTTGSFGTGNIAAGALGN